MNFYQTQSHFFLVFIIIGVFSLAAVPPILKSFASSSDMFVVEQMKLTQSNMYTYEIQNNSFEGVCRRGTFISLRSEIAMESGNDLICMVNHNNKNLALHTKLRSGKIFCVDSSGYQGYISGVITKGRCSK